MFPNKTLNLIIILYYFISNILIDLSKKIRYATLKTFYTYVPVAFRAIFPPSFSIMTECQTFTTTAMICFHVS